MTGQSATWYSSAVIAAIGVTIFGGYLVGVARSLRQEGHVAPRPWRSRGAVLCIFVSLMFFTGVNYLDAKTSPALFLLFWALTLFLTGWACVLAIKDILHTRQQFKIASGQPAELTWKSNSLHSTKPEEKI